MNILARRASKGVLPNRWKSDRFSCYDYFGLDSFRVSSESESRRAADLTLVCVQRSCAVMLPRQNEPPQPDPLACFITWTTYGTWLPGDERGWNDYGCGAQPPDDELEFRAAIRMTETECQLDPAERALVEETIRQHCAIRNWKLHACNCRSNHVHVVITAQHHPKIVMEQLKAWCTRRLKEHDGARLGQRGRRNRTKWWTERGSQRWLNDEVSLEAAIEYVLNGQ